MSIDLIEQLAEVLHVGFLPLGLPVERLRESREPRIGIERILIRGLTVAAIDPCFLDLDPEPLTRVLSFGDGVAPSFQDSQGRPVFVLWEKN